MKWPLNTSFPQVDFEYGMRRPKSRPVEWLLLTVAVAFLADVSWSCVKVERLTKVRKAELLGVLPTTPSASTQAVRDEARNPEAELTLARTTLNRLVLPWNELFKALSECNVEGVSVFAVEPLADAGTLNLTAEAANIPAMLTYVSRLESNKFFPTVTLTRHEVRKNEPRRPIAFAITATWRNKP